MSTDVRLEISPYDFAAARRLEEALGVSHTLAQVLVRRGLSDADSAEAFLRADQRHPLEAFHGLTDTAEGVLGHVARRSRITVHGDYDADGVCSTAILVRVLRTLGAQVDWYLPSRMEDGYGLAAATVHKLAQRGTQLLITADCAITAVEEVAEAKRLGLDVVVTDHHAPRADGILPDARILHPRLNGGNPCPDLCAAGVAYKLAGALLKAAGFDPALADEDLDLVALATVADVVPLHDENRSLVRAGLRRLAATRKPGLRALMAVSQVDPSGLDSTAIGFRLAPRINAAGRIARADAAMELILTEDEQRAREVAEELDAINARRRDVETRIRFEAEAMVGEHPDAPALVLAGEGWHPGVIGIVAARITERHHRPTVLIALEDGAGTGSGRSIPAFDLLEGLRAAGQHLKRFGGHRAAAGLTIEAADVEAFRAAFTAHAARTLAPEDLVPVEQIDAVVPGDALNMTLAEELRRLQPFGQRNPEVNLLVPCATLHEPRGMGEGRHVSFALAGGGARARAVRFGAGTTLPDGCVDAAVRLEVNAYNGTVEPRVVLRHAIPAAARPVTIVGEPDTPTGVLRELDRDLAATPEPAGERELRDVREGGAAGLLGDLLATGEPVLVVAAHAGVRADALGQRVGGVAVTSYAALEDQPWLAAAYTHVVALDPPATRQRQAVIEHAPGRGWTHLAWGQAELAFAQQIHEWEYALREPLIAVYRALRERRMVEGEACEALLRGDAPQPRTPLLAGRLVRVLTELGLASFHREGLGLEIVEGAPRTQLERSAAFRAYQARLEDGRTFLTSTTRAAA